MIDHMPRINCEHVSFVPLKTYRAGSKLQGEKTDPPNVAVLSPEAAPAVPDDPVVPVLGVGAVPDHLHGVVKVDVAPVGAAVEHAASVKLEPQSRSK